VRWRGLYRVVEPTRRKQEIFMKSFPQVRDLLLSFALSRSETHIPLLRGQKKVKIIKYLY
jgi:hypothetical protein